MADAAAALYNVRHEIDNFMPAKANPMPPPPRGVTVFQHYGYGGRSATLAAGTYRLGDLLRLGIRNDDISSAKVPAGMRLELYQHDNFKGFKTVVLADHSGFQRGFNDTTSSLIVMGR